MPRFELAAFTKYFNEGLASGGALIIIDRASGDAIGASRYYDVTADQVTVGYTFLARKYWGGKYNAEVKKLMLDHAFKSLKDVIFEVGANNLRSQKAMAKVGAQFFERTTKPGLNESVLDYIVYKIENPSK